MPARTEEARERAKAAARDKYASERAEHRRVDIKGAYRGPGNGDEGEPPNECAGCGERYKPHDYITDTNGSLVEPVLCLSCRTS